MSAGENTSNVPGDTSREGRIMLLLSQLMEAGHEDEQICRELGGLAKELNDDSMAESSSYKGYQQIHRYIDTHHLEILLGYMDLRRSQVIRSHATIAVSAYLKAVGNTSCDKISKFFYTNHQKGTPDGYVLAFSVAACLFPIVPDFISSLFLSEGFVPNLKVLMKNQWEDSLVRRAVIELVNAACMSTPCREAIRSFCTEWLEDLALNISASTSSKLSNEMNETDTSLVGQQDYDIHSEYIKDIAAIVLAKLLATPSTSATGIEENIRPVSISIEKLADDFKSMLFSGSAYQYSIEGLAYASLRPNVKEKLISDHSFLRTLLRVMGEAVPKSPLTYGALSILFNLTSFKPKLSEEQKRLAQIKSYASASNPSELDQFEQDDFVIKRCQAVFEAGTLPVLVSHSQYGSASSLVLVVSIFNSLSKLPLIRGKMAQQGAIKMLTHAYSAFPPENDMAVRITAQALARVLISVNPHHAFGGSNPNSITSAIPPLLHLLTDDLTTERDLLPTFESLLALTNLASTEDIARNLIIRHIRHQIEDFLLSNETLITRASVELICNLVYCQEGIAEFSQDRRLHIILALTDSADPATRKAAGGTLANLTQWDKAIQGVLRKENGIRLLLAFCAGNEDDLRHRGVVCILNIMSAPGELGNIGLNKVKEEGGIQALSQSLRSKSQPVLNVTVKALKLLFKDQDLDFKSLMGS